MEVVLRIIAVTLIYSSFLLPCFATFDLDPTFNGNGKLTISFPDSSTAYRSVAIRVFVQPSNRILVGGSFTNATADGQLSGVAWAGLTPGGALDPSFGSGGTFTDWRSDAFTGFTDALMYADGSTLRMSQVLRLPVGSSTVSTVRLTANGGFDNVFANNVSIGPCCFGFFNARPVQIAVRSDGKIWALITDQGEYLLHRLNPDGTRDMTFGVNGVLGITFNKFSPTNFVEMIALSDGKILLIGHAPSEPTTGPGEIFFARLTESGNWDKTFGRAGFVRVGFGAGLLGSVRKAVLQTDGKILLAGNIVNPDADVWMARFRPNGKRDTTFGSAGIAVHDLAPGSTDIASSIAISPDGKIRIAGEVGSAPSSFLVARFSATGAFEEQTSFSFTTGDSSGAADVALQPDGKLVVVGQTRNPNTAINGTVFAVARLTE